MTINKKLLYIMVLVRREYSNLLLYSWHLCFIYSRPEQEECAAAGTILMEE